MVQRNEYMAYKRCQVILPHRHHLKQTLPHVQKETLFLHQCSDRDLQEIDKFNHNSNCIKTNIILHTKNSFTTKERPGFYSITNLKNTRQPFHLCQHRYIKKYYLSRFPLKFTLPFTIFN